MAKRRLEIAQPGPEIRSIEFAPVTFQTVIEQEPEMQALFDEDLVVRQLTNDELESGLFPVDSIGMPLPIYVPDSYRKKEKNDHHHWGPDKELKNKSDYGELEKMLRYSTVQKVPVTLHNRFNKHFLRTPLATTRIGKIGHLMLAGAKYLGDQAVDVRPKIPEIRTLTLEERKKMWSKKELHLQNTRKIQDLLIDHVLKQDLPKADPAEVREFLFTSDEIRKIELGKKLFRLAAKAAVEPVELSYLRAWDSGFLPRQDLRHQASQNCGLADIRALPRDPHLFVARHVVPNQYVFKKIIKNELHSRMEEQLAAA